MVYNGRLRRFLIRLFDVISGNRIKNTLTYIDSYHNYHESKLPTNRKKLDNILSHAISSVPFYKKTVVIPKLEFFPVLTKNIITRDIDKYVSNKFKINKLHKSTTSGSTGSPFLFYYDDNKKINKTIEVIYYNGWVNYKLGDKHLLNAVGKKKGKLKRFIQNEIISNPTLMDENWLNEQRTILKNQNVLFYVGYASVIKELAEYCFKMGDKPSDFKLKGIKSTAERLDDKARLKAESVFGCPVLCRYGCMETGIIAQECQEFKNYHINIANYYVEVLRFESDEPVTPGEIGRVVVTDLNNFGMPFIRYDTGDLAVLSQKECSCGRKGPIFSEIIGRNVENVTDTKGNIISWVAINDKMWQYTNVSFFQFIQETKKNYLLLLQSEKNEDLAVSIINDFKPILGDDAILEVEFVSEIKQSGTGKRPYIINNYVKQTVNSTK